ncbi:MAG TPA: hypothetical protein ENN46_00580, partial [Candidatus Woesearchaeota archaeon]|nr:hypothetical protein [Candidatus Woesearchaeota archaeon]
SWLSIDAGTGAVTGDAPSVSADKKYTFTVTVADEHSASTSKSFSITVKKIVLPEIIVESIECFPRIVAGHEQVCSVKVTADGKPLSGATVKINRDTSAGTTTYAQCITDAITGACASEFIIDEPGTYTVYATAAKEGYTAWTSKAKSFTFEVFSERYDLREFEVYKDSAYSIPSDTFYRGEMLYAKFRIYDMLEEKYLVDCEVINEAKLVSFDAGGMIALNRDAVSNTLNPKYFHFRAQIPPIHDFFGHSAAFGFAFSYTDGSGGEVKKMLTILNNPPVISGLPSVIEIDAPYQLDLAPYATDLEDTNLKWEIRSFDSSIITASITGNTLLNLAPVIHGQTNLKLRVYDLNNDYDEGTILIKSIVTPPNQPPIITNVNNPSQVYEGDFVSFTVEAYDPDGDDITFSLSGASWLSIDAGTGAVIGDAPSVSADKKYTFTVTVTDEHSASTSKSFSITVKKIVLPEITVESIECFPRSVAGHEQVCSVKVSSESEPLSGATVKIRDYTSSFIYAQCITDAITGACASEFIIDEPGTYTVYATAAKEGYTAWTSKAKSFTFEVFSERYDLREFEVYKDSGYSIPSDTFYRGEMLYAKFRIYDMLEEKYVHDSGLVKEAKLVSYVGGGMVDMQSDSAMDTANPGFIHFKLQVPIVHDFIGESAAFGFVFNFSDNSGGEVKKMLTILNNPPVISGLPSVIEIDAPYQLDLAPYATDLEDTNLKWEIVSFDSSVISAHITGNSQLSLAPLADGETSLVLRVYDLNNDYDEGTILVKSSVTPPNLPPVIEIEQTQFAVQVGDELRFSFRVYDPDGDEITITFPGMPASASINDKGSGNFEFIWVPSSAGNYTFKILAADHELQTEVEIRISVYDDKEPEEEDPLYRSNDQTRINRIAHDYEVKPGDQLYVMVSIDNNLREEREFSVLAIVPELGIRMRSYERVEGGETLNKRLFLEIPKNAQPGEYLLRISVNNEVLNRHRHRIIKVI